jgi:hypothetical protein
MGVGEDTLLAISAPPDRHALLFRVSNTVPLGDMRNIIREFWKHLRIA